MSGLAPLPRSAVPAFLPAASLHLGPSPARALCPSSHNRIPTRIPIRAPSMTVAPAHVSVGGVSEQLGAAVEAAAKAAISEHGHFSVAISGGSLPKLLAAGLSSDVDPTDWRVFLADERLVPLDDPDSNYLELRTRLPDLSPVPVNPTLSPRRCADDYARQIGDALGARAFDLVLLGLGPDGHTASLFPGHPLLQETTRAVAEITNSPKPPPERVTLTLPELARAHNIFFVVTGAGKAPVVKDIVENPDSKLPGALVTAQAPPHWFLDEAAAGELSPAYAASSSS